MPTIVVLPGGPSPMSSTSTSSLSRSWYSPALTSTVSSGLACASAAAIVEKHQASPALARRASTISVWRWAGCIGSDGPASTAGGAASGSHGAASAALSTLCSFGLATQAQACWPAAACEASSMLVQLSWRQLRDHSVRRAYSSFQLAGSDRMLRRCLRR